MLTAPEPTGMGQAARAVAGLLGGDRPARPRVHVRSAGAVVAHAAVWFAPRHTRPRALIVGKTATAPPPQAGRLPATVDFAAWPFAPPKIFR